MSSKIKSFPAEGSGGVFDPPSIFFCSDDSFSCNIEDAKAQPLSHGQRPAFPAPRNIVKQTEAQDRSFGGEKSGSIGLRIDDPPRL